MRILEPIAVDYIKSQLESGDPVRIKKALQRLCKLYRKRLRIHPAKRIGIEQSIVGLLYTQGKDEKVRRWGLNALAHLGTEAACKEAILHNLGKYGDQPQTAAAAVAAIHCMSRRASEVLQPFSFDKQVAALGALQHIEASKLDLSALPIDVDKASPDILKLGLVVVGLDRAPPNMLNPRHNNSQMVKALGSHHDNIVAQYSVWAITENPTLTINDLGIDIRTVEALPTNVRSWIYQLLAMSAKNAKHYMEYIQLGARDLEPEARAGLSFGFKDTFFDGLEALVLDWFVTETDLEVRQNLLDHMVRQASHCPSYDSMATEIYEAEPPGSALRQRMEAMAVNTPLYRKFRRIELDGTLDLFRGGSTMTKNTFNISGAVGAVSIGGNADNTGATSVHYNSQTVDIIRSELSRAERELHAAQIEGPLKAEALEQVQAAKVDPTADKLAKAINVLGKVESVATKTVSTGAAISKIVSALGKLTGLLPGP